jgi:hypothetical protein
LAISTIGLWRYAGEQASDTKRLIAATTATAEAAKTELKLMMGTQLPRVILSYTSQYIVTGLQTTDYVHGRLPERSYAMFGFRNIGSGPAFPTRCVFNWVVAENLPGQPIYTRECLEAGVTFPAGSALEPAPRIPIEVTTEEADAIDTGTKKLWLWGKLFFGDVLNGINEYGFLMVWNPHQPPPLGGIPSQNYGWVQDGSRPDYAYSKRDKGDGRDDSITQALRP